MPPMLLTASALPSTTMPSDSTVGSRCVGHHDAETLLAADGTAGDVDLAALLDAGHRVQVEAGEVLAVDLDRGAATRADLRIAG